nr:hypothetical protein [Tanacetum cinerariifolium]
MPERLNGRMEQLREALEDKGLRVSTEKTEYCDATTSSVSFISLNNPSPPPHPLYFSGHLCQPSTTIATINKITTSTTHLPPSSSRSPNHLVTTTPPQHRAPPQPTSISTTAPPPQPPRHHLLNTKKGTSGSQPKKDALGFCHHKGVSFISFNNPSTPPHPLYFSATCVSRRPPPPPPSTRSPRPPHHLHPHHLDLQTTSSPPHLHSHRAPPQPTSISTTGPPPQPPRHNLLNTKKGASGSQPKKNALGF